MFQFILMWGGTVVVFLIVMFIICYAHESDLLGQIRKHGRVVSWFHKNVTIEATIVPREKE